MMEKINMVLSLSALKAVWLVAVVSLLLVVDGAHALANSTSAPYANTTSSHTTTLTNTTLPASITTFHPPTSTKPPYDPWSALTNRTLASYCFSVSTQNFHDNPPKYTTITATKTFYRTLGTMVSSWPTSRWYTWTLDFTTSSALQTWMMYDWRPTLTVPTTTYTYTDTHWISSSWWYPSSPCCGPCTIYAQNTMMSGAKLLYWPTPAPPNYPSTLVNNYNYTFIAPSPYIAFVALYAWDLCGKVGRTDLAYKTMPYAPDEISTYLDFGDNAPARSFDFADISGNCSTIKSLHGEAVKYNPCFPMIKLPDRIKDLDPKWATCELQKWGADDPPVALKPQANLMPVTTAPGPDPTIKPTAEPVQVSSVVNGVTATAAPTGGAVVVADPPAPPPPGAGDPPPGVGDPPPPSPATKGPTRTVIPLGPSQSLTLDLPPAGQGQAVTLSIAPGQTLTLTPGAAGTVIPIPGIPNTDPVDPVDPKDPADPAKPGAGGAAVDPTDPHNVAAGGTGTGAGSNGAGPNGSGIFISLGTSALVVGSSTYALPPAQQTPSLITLAPGVVLTLPTLLPGGDPSNPGAGYGGAGAAGYVVQVGPHSSITLLPGGKGQVLGGGEVTVSMAPNGGGLVVVGKTGTTTIGLPTATGTGTGTAGTTGTGTGEGLGGAIWTGVGGGDGVGGASVEVVKVTAGVSKVVNKESAAARRYQGRGVRWAAVLEGCAVAGLVGALV